MGKEQVITSQAPAAIGPYSQAIIAGDFVYTSSQLPMDPETGALVGDSVEVQTVRALENAGAVLAAAGLTFEDVVKTTVFLCDMADFAATYFSSPYPARSCVAVAALPRGARVEIEMVAVRRQR
jgi:2-iminobutanoate/2-iminopropanoate deaminase